MGHRGLYSAGRKSLKRVLCEPCGGDSAPGIVVIQP